jgi:hypothetical protein
MNIDIKEFFEVRNSLVMMKFAFRVIFMRPPFSKWLPTKSSNCQWSPISMKIDISEYFEVRNWLVMMKLASTCPNSDMGVVWGLQCLHANTIKPRYYYYSPFFLSVAHAHVQGRSQELLDSFVVKGVKVIF